MLKKCLEGVVQVVDKPELLSDDVEGRIILTAGVISDRRRGASGRSFFAGLKKLQKAHRNAAYSYSSCSAIPGKSKNDMNRTSSGTLKLTVVLKALLADHSKTVCRTITYQIVNHLINYSLLGVVDDWIRSPCVASSNNSCRG